MRHRIEKKRHWQKQDLTVTIACQRSLHPGRQSFTPRQTSVAPLKQAHATTTMGCKTNGNETIYSVLKRQLNDESLL